MHPKSPHTPNECRSNNDNRSIWLAHFFIHLTGISAITVLLLFAIVSPSTTSTVIRQFIEVPELSKGLYLHLLMHVGCAAAVWALTFFCIKMLNSVLKHGKKAPEIVRLKATVGAILVETLIVMPVLLLFIFGLSQFAINNIATIISRYAAYSGARTAWIWQPEHQANRKNITHDDVVERAKISIALAMTPVASGEFTTIESNTSVELESIRRAMYNRFSNPASIPLLVAQHAPGLYQFSPRENTHFAGALDTSSFSTRAVRKLTHAYLATEIPSNGPGVTQDNGRIGVQFTYWHHQTMPLVGKIFGERTSKGGRAGYYMPMRIEYSFPRQKHHVNARLPAR